MEGFLIVAGLVVFALLFNLVSRVRKLEARLYHLENASPESAANQDALPSSQYERQLDVARAPAPARRAARKRTTSVIYDSLIRQLQHNGLLWLGGVTLALGGVFLALYAIEAGILSPAIRLFLGGMFGISLVAVAEYLTRYRLKFNIHTPYIPAAIACGGIICCYSIIMVAFNAFSLISASAAFLLLAILSLLATWLTLRYGLLLAVVGIIGAYLVPMLIPSQNSSLLLLVGYLSVVTASATYISQRVTLPALALSSLAIHIALSFGALLSAESVHVTAALLNAGVLLYLYGLVPVSGWSMRACKGPVKWYPSKQGLAAAVLSSSFIATAMWLSNSAAEIFTLGAMTTVLLLLITIRARQFMLLSPAALLMTGIAIVVVSLTTFSELTLFSPLTLFTQSSALVLSIFGVVMSRHHRDNGAFHMLYTLSAPMLTLLLVTVTDAQADTGEVIGGLTVVLSVYGLTAAVTLLRCSHSLTQMYVTLALHTSLLAIAIMQLSGSLLSVFLAWQMGLLIFQSARQGMSVPVWIYKLVALVLITRLTVLLWGWSLFSSDATSNYSPLTTYALVLMPLIFSYWYASELVVKRWFAGVILHIVALMTTSLSVWWLTGETHVSTINYKTAALLACNWSLLAVVYRWRSSHSAAPRVMSAFSALLITGVLMFHVELSVGENPFFEHQLFSTEYVAIWLTILWGLPGLALCTLGYLWRHVPLFKSVQLVTGGVSVILWINALIRSAFQHDSLYLHRGFSQSELYTYSVVWLLLATAILFTAQRLKLPGLKKTGFGMLLLVVCKVFLIDMSHLTGLWRAVSFLGLGGSLVLLGWLFQRFSQPAESKEVVV